MIAKLDAPLRGMDDVVLEEVTSIQLNDWGQMVVFASVQQDGASVQSLLRYSPAAGFETIVELDSIVDDHGVDRAISSFTNACDKLDDRQRQCLDEDGRLVFVANYSDNSAGLIIADPMPSGGEDVSLPEPANLNASASSDAGAQMGNSDGGGSEPDEGTLDRHDGGDSHNEDEFGEGETPDAAEQGESDSASANAKNDNACGDAGSNNDGCSVAPIGKGRDGLSKFGLLLFAMSVARLARRRKVHLRSADPLDQ